MPQEIEVSVVSNLDCKPCKRVKGRLDKLKTEFPGLLVSEIDIGSSEGMAIAVRHGLAGLPGILIYGRMVLVGDVSEQLLRESLSGAIKRHAIPA